MTGPIFAPGSTCRITGRSKRISPTTSQVAQMFTLTGSSWSLPQLQPLSFFFTKIPPCTRAPSLSLMSPLRVSMRPPTSSPLLFVVSPTAGGGPPPRRARPVAQPDVSVARFDATADLSTVQIDVSRHGGDVAADARALAEADA